MKRKCDVSPTEIISLKCGRESQALRFLAQCWAGIRVQYSRSGTVIISGASKQFEMLNFAGED